MPEVTPEDEAETAVTAMSVPRLLRDVLQALSASTREAIDAAEELGRRAEIGLAIEAHGLRETWRPCSGAGFDGYGHCPNLTPDPSGACVTHRMVVGTELLAAQAEVRARRSGLPPGQLLARDGGAS